MKLRGSSPKGKKQTTSRAATPLRMDPTRLVALRRRLKAEMVRRFNVIRLRVLDVIGTEDAFGLGVSNGDPLLSVNFNPYHDRLGRFASGSGGGGAVAVAGGGRSLMDLAKSWGAKASHAEHAVKSYVTDKVGAAVARLPGPLRKAVQAGWAVGKVGTTAAFATWTLGQKLAERVSLERGHTPEQARRLRGVLSSMDIVAFKPLSLGLATTGVGHGLALGLSMVPPVTAGYLAYSTARNPLATYRAARGLVRDAAHYVSTLNELTTNSDYDRAAAVDTALTLHRYDDWYIALLHAAMEGSHSVKDALATADELFQAHPVDPSTPQEDDEEWLTGGLVSNVFCSTGEGGGIDPHCSPEGGHASLASIKSDLDKIKEYVSNHHGGMIEGVSITGSFARGNADRKGKGTSDIDVVIHPKDVRGARDAAYAIRSYLEKKLGTTRRVQGIVGDMEGETHNNFITLWGRTTVRRSPLASTEFIIRHTHPPTTNQRWRLSSVPDQVKAFAAWLDEEIQAALFDSEWWIDYVQEAYMKGAARAFDDVKAPVTRFGKDAAAELAGAKRLFMSQLMFRRVRGSGPAWVGNARHDLRGAGGKFVTERVHLLAIRFESEMQGVTAAMAQKMARDLADGLSRNATPDQIAAAIAESVPSIGINRATTLAETEMTRDHAEGQLDAMEDLGIEEVEAAVEWVTRTGACELCQPLDGVVLKIDEARNRIPRHARCRCSWLPLPKERADQIRSAARIKTAFKESAEAGNDNFDKGLSIARRRPTLNQASMDPDLFDQVMTLLKGRSTHGRS